MSVLVTIEKLVQGGHGLCRLPGGMKAFVPGTLPGEKARIELTERRRDYAFGTLVELVSPSPHRMTPECPYYGACGGCQLQHVSYAQEILLKGEMFMDAMRRVDGLDSCEVSPVVPSPLALSYRHRLKFNVDSSTGLLGFLRQATHELVPLERCLLAGEGINSVLSALPDLPAWKRVAPAVDSVTIGLSPLDELSTLFVKATRPIALKDLRAVASEAESVKSVFVKPPRGRAKGPYPADALEGGRRLFPLPFPAMETDAAGKRIEATPGVFVQNNWEINRMLVERVARAAGMGPSMRVLDLHCGIGNFLLSLGRAKEAVGVDADERALEDAARNARALGISVTLLNKTDMEAAVQLVEEARTYDTVILDPPRGGCRGVLPYLRDLVMQRLLYISCDPPTLARDIRILQSLGFVLKELHCFDMFPRTFHMEALALLEKD